MITRILSNHHLVLWMIFVLGFAARGYGLSVQPPLNDEAAAASAASNYLDTGLFGQVMWYHPPLRNIVIYFSGELFGGYSAWGLRFGSILFGSLTVPALGYLAYSLFRNKAISYLAAFFLCIDPLHISLSREAVQETTTSFFLVAGVMAAYHGIRRDSVLSCYVSGALFGFSAASKWHALFPWTVSVLAFLFAPQLIDGYEGERNFLRRLLTALSAFLAIPVMLYITAYLPWLHRGNSLHEFFDLQQWLVTRQYIHKASEYTETYLPKGAYLWFLWPTQWPDFVFHQGKAYLNIAMGNFLVWVLTLPSLVVSIRSWLSEKGFELGYLIALFLCSYLPLVLTTRGIWAFNSLAVIPFAFLLSAVAMTRLVAGNNRSRNLAALYLLMAVTVSALLYPAATMRALEYSYLKPLADLYSPHR